MDQKSPCPIETVLKNLPWVEEARVFWHQSGRRPWAAIWPRMEKVRQDRWVNIFEALRFRMENAVLALPVGQRPEGWTLMRTPKEESFRDFDGPRILGDQPPRFFPPDPGGEELPGLWQDWIRSSGMVPASLKRLTRNTSLEFDLGLDSLDRLAFLLAWGEAGGRSLEEGEFLSMYTLGDVVDWWGTARPPQAVPRPRPGLVMKDNARGESLRPWGTWPLVLLTRVILRYRFWKKMGLCAEGLEWLQREEGPLIIAQNHQSNIDPTLVCDVLSPRWHRRLFFLGFTGYFSSGKGRLASRIYDILPISADEGALAGLRQAAAAVKKGRVLLIYPEGERSWDGALKPFRRGVAWIAREAGARVVPSAVAGAYCAWPRGGSLRPHPVKVAFGPALDPPGEDPSDERAFLLRLSQDIATLMRGLGEDPERGHPEVWGAIGGGSVAAGTGRD